MKGLIIKEPWIDLILDGKKVMEIRGSNTHVRGTVALIKSGTGMVIGEVEIVDSITITPEEYRSYERFHKIQDTETLPYKKIHGWVMINPVRYETPIPYKHPQGAVIWVDLTELYANIHQKDISNYARQCECTLEQAQIRLEQLKLRREKQHKASKCPDCHNHSLYMAKDYTFVTCNHEGCFFVTDHVHEYIELDDTYTFDTVLFYANLKTLSGIHVESCLGMPWEEYVEKENARLLDERQIDLKKYSIFTY